MKKLALVLILLLSLSACVGSRTPGSPQVQKVEITATQWAFSPGQVRVKNGLPVELKVYSADVDHGMEFLDMDVPVERVPAGRTVYIRFLPYRAGEYHFRCAVVCGAGHDEMSGTLIVEEQ